MIRKLAICLLLLSVSLVAQDTFTYSYNGAPVWIFTDAANIASVASIPVSRAFTVQKVTVSVNVAYLPVGDLNLFLFAPDGTRTKLLERNCGDTGSLINISFDDAASSKYADVCPAGAGQGSFQGNEPLSNFNDKTSYGIWRLAVENNGSQRTGWLNGWSITFTGGTVNVPTAVDVVNRSSLKPGGVAPNSDILIYGSNLGPADPVYAASGETLPTTLSGVQVFLNDKALPLKGVSSVAVDAVVPADAVVGETAFFEVAVNGTKTSKVSATVQATAPGLFSQGQLGDITSSSWAIVKAVDQTYKPITKDNPAVAGSIVTVYATGLGVTDPAFTAGEVPPNEPLYTTKTATNASIGGVAAEVMYAGLAPGFPAVYQLNIKVPEGLGNGNQLILIWNGGGVSQDNLALPVKAK